MGPENVDCIAALQGPGWRPGVGRPKWGRRAGPRDDREARAGFECAGGVAFVDYIARLATALAFGVEDWPDRRATAQTGRMCGALHAPIRNTAWSIRIHTAVRDCRPGFSCARRSPAPRWAED